MRRHGPWTTNIQRVDGDISTLSAFSLQGITTFITSKIGLWIPAAARMTGENEKSLDSNSPLPQNRFGHGVDFVGRAMLGCESKPVDSSWVLKIGPGW